MFGNRRAPEKILEDVDIYLSDINVPNYAAIQALEKGIKEHPDNAELKEKLKEIQESNDISISQSSPKTLYGILVISIGAIGIGLVLSYATNNASAFGLVLGISFIIGAAIIFKQYLKEN